MTNHFTDFGVMAAVHEVYIAGLRSDGTTDAPDTLLAVGATQRLKAFLYDEAGTELTDRVVRWSVLDELSTVDSTGLMTARSPGLTTVVAESEGRTDTVRTVIPRPPMLLLFYGPFFNSLAVDQFAVYRLELRAPNSGEPAPPAAALTVSLSAASTGGTGSVRLPTSLTVPAGQSYVDFPVQGATLEGQVEITASAAGYRTATRRLSIGLGSVHLRRDQYDDLPVGQRTPVRIRLEGRMGVATTFTLTASSNVRFTDAAGTPITTYTFPATDWSTIDPVMEQRQGPYNSSEVLYLEGLVAGPATYGISHPNFQGWPYGALTVVP
jgi:hypothetical protein